MQRLAIIIVLLGVGVLFQNCSIQGSSQSKADLQATALVSGDVLGLYQATALSSITVNSSEGATYTPSVTVYFNQTNKTALVHVELLQSSVVACSLNSTASSSEIYSTVMDALKQSYLATKADETASSDSEPHLISWDLFFNTQAESSYYLDTSAVSGATEVIEDPGKLSTTLLSYASGLTPQDPSDASQPCVAAPASETASSN